MKILIIIALFASMCQCLPVGAAADVPREVLEEAREVAELIMKESQSGEGYSELVVARLVKMTLDELARGESERKNKVGQDSKAAHNCPPINLNFASVITCNC